MDQVISTQVYETKPEDFKTSVQVSACYLEVDGHLLLLECSSAKEEAGKWGVPGGKTEIHELSEDTARRELFEETGIQVEHSDLESMGTLYFRKPEVDYVYHLFRIALSERPEIRLSNEHPTYCWAKFQDLESLPLNQRFLNGWIKRSFCINTIQLFPSNALPLA